MNRPNVTFALAALGASLGIPTVAALQHQATSPSTVQRSRGAYAERSLLDAPDARQLRLAEAYGKLPLGFEANSGQTNPQVKYLSRGPGYSLFLTDSEAVLALRGTAKGEPVRNLFQGTREAATLDSDTAILRMKLLGANRAAAVTGLDELPGTSNYFIGDDPTRWRTNVANYGKVRFSGVYPGVDLLYYGNHRQLEYDFVVAPGAAPSAIRLDFSGAEQMQIDSTGELRLHTRTGEVRWHKPMLYQEIGGVRQTVDGRYVQQGKTVVTFEVHSYDHAYPLVIDPVLVYSTYLGGSNADGSLFFLPVGIAVDRNGNAYVTGGTGSPDFPTTVGSLQTAYGTNIDAFVTKFNPAGSTVVYSTYLGGNDSDAGDAIAVDSSGNAYITGQTRSADFPMANPFQATLAAPFTGTADVFVTKLNPAGSALVYSTYLGGNGNDSSKGIAVDNIGDVYIAGGTNSTNFPTANAFQSICHGCSDAFVAKFNSSGSALIYSTYLGGSKSESATGIAADSNGNAYVTGGTSSSDFPTTVGAFQTVFGG